MGERATSPARISRHRPTEGMARIAPFPMLSVESGRYIDQDGIPVFARDSTMRRSAFRMCRAPGARRLVYQRNRRKGRKGEKIKKMPSPRKLREKGLVLDMPERGPLRRRSRRSLFRWDTPSTFSPRGAIAIRLKNLMQFHYSDDGARRQLHHLHILKSDPPPPRSSSRARRSGP